MSIGWVSTAENTNIYYGKGSFASDFPWTLKLNNCSFVSLNESKTFLIFFFFQAEQNSYDNLNFYESF